MKKYIGLFLIIALLLTMTSACKFQKASPGSKSLSLRQDKGLTGFPL